MLDKATKNSEKQDRKTAASKQRKMQAGVNAKDRREGARKEKAAQLWRTQISGAAFPEADHPEPGHEHMIKSVVERRSRATFADRRARRR